MDFALLIVHFLTFQAKAIWSAMASLSFSDQTRNTQERKR
jgi:hypothetical protein